MNPKDKPKVGRPRKWERKTKVSVDIETSALLKKYAEVVGMPVIDFMYNLVRYPKFPDLVNDMAETFKQDNEDD